MVKIYYIYGEPDYYIYGEPDYYIYGYNFITFMVSNLLHLWLTFITLVLHLWVIQTVCSVKFCGAAFLTAVLP